jgi:hypothetical protein
VIAWPESAVCGQGPESRWADNGRILIRPRTSITATPKPGEGAGAGGVAIDQGVGFRSPASSDRPLGRSTGRATGRLRRCRRGVGSTFGSSGPIEILVPFSYLVRKSIGPLHDGIGCALIEDHAQMPDVRHL